MNTLLHQRGSVANGVLVGAIVLLILALLALYFASPNEPVSTLPDTQDAVFCTQDARQCPDGTYVGRIPPTCEFAPCPGN